MLAPARVVWLILVLTAYLAAHPVSFGDAAGLMGGFRWESASLTGGLLPSVWTSVQILVFLGLVNLAAAGWGNRFLRWLGLPRGGWQSVGLGLGCAMPVWLGVGLTGLWMPLAAVVVLAAGLLCGGRSGFRRMGESWRVFRIETWNPWALLLLPAFTALSAAVVVPETQYDPVLYHLGLGSRYVVVHKIVRLEQLHLAGFPQNATMLFGWLAACGGQPLAKAANIEMSFLTACAMAAIAGSSARTALLLLLGSPLVWMYASSAYAEATLVFFQTAALGCLALHGGRWAVLGAVFAGLAAGTKYQAVLALLPLAAIGWWRRDALGLRRPVRLFTVVVCVGVGWLPWGAKNWLFTGNPVHPLLERVIPSIEGAWAVAEQRPWSAPPADGWIPGGLAGPWRFVMHDAPENSAGRGPLMLAVLPWLVGVSAGPATVYAAGFWAVWWFVTRNVGRYIMGLLPALLAAGWAAWRIRAGSTPPGLRRLEAALLVAAVAAGHAGGLHLVGRSLDQFAYAAGCVDREAYLGARFGAVRYVVHKKVDRWRVTGRRTLVYGDPLPIFHGGRWLMDTESRTPWLERRSRAARSPVDLARAMRQRNIDTILYWMNGGIQISTGVQRPSWTPRALGIAQEYFVTYGSLEVLHESTTGADSWYLWRLDRTPKRHPVPECGSVGMHLPTAEPLLLDGDRAHSAGNVPLAARLYAATAARFPGYIWARQRLAMATHRPPSGWRVVSPAP